MYSEWLERGCCEWFGYHLLIMRSGDDHESKSRGIGLQV